MAGETLQRNFLVTSVVSGVNLGIAVSHSGGQTEIDGQKTRVGGMSDEVAVGGPASTENVTVTYVFGSYMKSKYKWLRSQLNQPMSVTVTPLGNNRQPDADAETFTGLLARVSPPESDDNGSDVSMIELELLTNQSVA